MKIALKAGENGFVTSYWCSVGISLNYMRYLMVTGTSTAKVFPGNSDLETVVETCVNYVDARYVRVLPSYYHTRKSMRWEIYTMVP